MAWGPMGGCLERLKRERGRDVGRLDEYRSLDINRF